MSGAVSEEEPERASSSLLVAVVVVAFAVEDLRARARDCRRIEQLDARRRCMPLLLVRGRHRRPAVAGELTRRESRLEQARASAHELDILRCRLSTVLRKLSFQNCCRTSCDTTVV